MSAWWLVAFIGGLFTGGLAALVVMLWLVLTTRRTRLEQVNGVKAVELAAAALHRELNGGELAYASWDALYRGAALAALRAAWPELARPYLRGYLVTGQASTGPRIGRPLMQTRRS